MNYADNERQEMQKVIREHCTDIKADFQKGIDKFKNLCQIIKEASYPPKEAWDCIKEELKDYIPKSTLYRWSDEIIPEAKALTRPKKIPNLGISGVPLAKGLGRLPIKPLKRRCQLANEWHSLTLIASGVITSLPCRILKLSSLLSSRCPTTSTPENKKHSFIP